MNRWPAISRREALKKGGSALAVLAFFDSPLFALGREGERTIPFLDQPPPPPQPLVDMLGTDLRLLDWQELDSWLTPAKSFFHVWHFNLPEIDSNRWKLEISGLVNNAARYTFDEIKALPKREVVHTLECSGNSGFDWFQGGIGNARWGGTPLAPILERAGIKSDGIEVVFYGIDEGDAIIPYLDGFGNKVEDIQAKQSFARSMSLDEAMDPANLLSYEMNGEPLSPENGFPIRLVAPRWFGIASVKWLKRIEVQDTRFMGTFMAERYVTVREEPRAGGETVLTRTSVGRSLLKSITAKVTVKDGKHRIYGAAWGAPVERVEVRIDEGPWMSASIDEGQEHEFAWKFWHVDWADPAAGEHRISSRAIDKDGNVQPAPDDWRIAGKRTYWEANQQITRTIKI
jgi:DMSO/TMAO reductase YedYZ molybdopterin-dependent catalytic subunit